eukprot:CAMPEP_0171198952 /NCGR_PEP_ID=MMETSP0790-20130122/23213_1 /TAXON_ID=2925 /ORGANISM="Alexandrium catenella, Strain OF101" /LENGTH=466 /DNA_ID=CAMNT_0011664283 /DNA_START=58 /DNA_END=1458 /DNA_ORIENTATION=+
MAPLRALAASLLPGVAALRSPEQLVQHRAVRGGQVYRQKLGNLQDLQYFGDLSIGDQPLKAIFDTGSFELVVFSAFCPNCGVAGEYNEQSSATFQQGKITKTHAYGSGSCEAQDGYDTVQVGTVTAEKQAIWVANDCKIPLLSQASFNAIAGLGPPGQPAFTAESQVRQLEQLEARFKDSNEKVPEELLKAKEQAVTELEAAQSKHELLDTMGVQTVSTCLGRAPGSPGYLIWNDKTRAGRPGVQQVPVAGNITWSMRAQELGLASHNGEVAVVGCENGCGAIVDTGTSLIAVPGPIYKAVAEQIRQLDIPMDCSDLSKFPDLVLSAGGQKLRFPPSAYLGSYTGRMDADTQQFVRTEALGDESMQTPCQLLLMDLGATQKTTLGPMVILGMPFFREYYTTFDLGTGRGDRSFFISKATDSCVAGEEGDLVAGNRMADSLRYKPRTVDLGAVRVPHWYKQAQGKGL